jgi:hypothetical protein
MQVGRKRNTEGRKDGEGSNEVMQEGRKEGRQRRRHQVRGRGVMAGG